jgi:LmbE family N-acetylglucosaminyl deacetylase
VTLEPIPETWTRALAVVAHPDDLEYGAASAIARWTATGRSVGYVIVTDGEAGIDAIPPVEAAVLRQKEQLASAAIVGVEDVSFLHHRRQSGHTRSVGDTRVSGEMTAASAARAAGTMR